MPRSILTEFEINLSRVPLRFQAPAVTSKFYWYVTDDTRVASFDVHAEKQKG